MKEGPSIEELTRHLAECPPVFLAEPLQPGGIGEVDVAAVVCDLVAELGGSRPGNVVLEGLRYSPFDSALKARPQLRLCLLTAWLATHPQLREGEHAEKLLQLLTREVPELAALVNAETVVGEPERREELVRLLLRGYELLPAGESEEEAENRFDALSSVKREQVVKAAQEAEKRARKLREEIAAKEAARRAASVYSYE